jgi:signal transduction histidine kinase
LRMMFGCFLLVTVIVSGIQFSLVSLVVQDAAFKQFLWVILGGALLQAMMLGWMFVWVVQRYLRRPLAHGIEPMLDTLERLEAENASLKQSLTQERAHTEKAVQANASLQAKMGHKLRTPLNAVLGYAQLLHNDSSLSVRQMADVNTILRNGELLRAWLADLTENQDAEGAELVPASANTNQSPPRPGVPVQDLVALKLPPMSEVSVLYELVLDGNLGRLRKHAQALLQQDPALEAFVQKLLCHADDFQAKAIQHWLAAIMEAHQDV